MDSNISIIPYIKTNNTHFYNRVLDIVKYLENISMCEIHIYGGFVRNIIDNYYSDNNIITKDVDLWFAFDRNISVNYNYWKEKVDRMIIQLRRKYNIENYIYFNLGDTREKYGLCKITIDGIEFDFCTKINDEDRFSKLCDFTVNNLYINTNSKIYTRINSIYKIEEILAHIKNKKLVSILDNDIINSYNISNINNIYNININNNYYYYDLMEKRKYKMLNYGYN
jgi:hypothetical protein